MPAIWTNATKSGAPSWATASKSLSGNSDILLENSSYMLLESNFKIILEQSVSTSTPWTTATKS